MITSFIVSSVELLNLPVEHVIADRPFFFQLDDKDLTHTNKGGSVDIFRRQNSETVKPE